MTRQLRSRIIYSRKRQLRKAMEFRLPSGDIATLIYDGRATWSDLDDLEKTLHSFIREQKRFAIQRAQS